MSRSDVVQEKPAAELDVKVLTSGHWPSHPPVSLALPAELASCVKTFQEYFGEATNHKKLVWIYTQVCFEPQRRGTGGLDLRPGVLVPQRRGTGRSDSAGRSPSCA